jgi:hypothetical protein
MGFVQGGEEPVSGPACGEPVALTHANLPGAENVQQFGARLPTGSTVQASFVFSPEKADSSIGGKRHTGGDLIVRFESCQSTDIVA